METPGIPSVRILVNGKPRDITRTTTIQDLIEQLELQATPVAVAVNEKVIPKKAWRITRLEEGNRVEVIRIVAGG